MAEARSNKIQVCVRLRPLNETEKEKETTPVVQASSVQSTITVVRGKGKTALRHGFKFDRVYGTFTTQKEIFEETLLPIIGDVMKGYDATVFAYGQTGTGKTHTMEGVINDEELMGVIPRAAKVIFERISHEKYTSSKVTCSYLEIYNEDLCDLLVDETKATKLTICAGKKTTRCFGLSEKKINKAEDIIKVLHTAQEKRQIAETEMNKFSSRSHCLFTLNIKTTERHNDCLMERQGKLHLVDLAGSESAKAIDHNAKRMRESTNINQSLLTLGRVITALRKKQPRIPYRDSKLTRLLQEALGGRSKTCIIATLSPSVLCVEETLSTLKYAQRANGIKNKTVNAATRMSVNDGGSKGLSAANTDSFLAMEMRVKYLETQCEDAQAALARKHARMQEAVDRLSSKQRECDETNGRLEEALNTVAKLQATKFLLRKQLAQSTNETERLQLLINARTATERALQSHSKTLIQSLDSSIEQSRTLHTTLERQSGVQHGHFQAVSDYCTEALGTLQRLRTHSETSGTTQQRQQGELESFFARDAHGEGVAMLRALKGRVETLALLVNEATKTFENDVAAAKTLSTDATNAMTAAQKETSTNMVDKLQTTATRMREQLQELMATVSAESSTLEQWRKRNREAADKAQIHRASALSMKQQYLGTFETASTTLIRRQEELVLALRQKSTAAAEALDQIAASNKLHQAHLEDTYRRASAASTSMQQSMEKQQRQLASALEQHAEPEASNTQNMLNELHTIHMEAQATHDKSLNKQQNHIANALAIDAKQQQQRAEHSEKISNLLKSTTDQSDKQRKLLAAMTANLELAVTRQNEGNLREDQLEALEQHRVGVADATIRQTDLMREQLQTLKQTLEMHTENDPEQHHLDTLRQTQNSFQQYAASNRALIEQQQATLEQHREQQKEQAKQFMTIAMDTFKTMMEEQMSSMSTLLANQISAVTTANKTLIDQETEMGKKFETNSLQAVEETTAWGTRLKKVAKSMEDVIMVQNTDMAISVGTLAADVHTAIGDLCNQTTKWGASNDVVLKQINDAIGTTAEADSNTVALQTSVAEATADLTAHTTAIGVTETDVMNRLGTMQTQQQLLIKEATDISATATADKQTLDQQLLKWINKEQRVAEEMKNVVAEVRVCEAKRAEAAIDLESKLSREAVATTVQQTERVEAVCAGVRQQVAEEVTASEGVAAKMHADLGEFEKTLAAHIAAAKEANIATHTQHVADLTQLAEARSKSEAEISSEVENMRGLVNTNENDVAASSQKATTALEAFSNTRTQWWNSFATEQTGIAIKNRATADAEKEAADARVEAGKEHLTKAVQTLSDMTKRFTEARQELHGQVVADVDGGCESVNQLQQHTSEATEKIPAPHTLVTPEVKRYIASTPEDLKVERAHGFVRFSEATYAAENKQTEIEPEREPETCRRMSHC